MSRRGRASDPFMWLDTSVAQNVSALLLAEFSAEVAPQTSLRRSFEHARTLGLSGVRDYLHLASATVAVWAQHSWPQNWGHRGNMTLHFSVTQKITENWFHFWGHSATEFEGFPLVLIGQFAHAWVPRRPGRAWDAALSTRKRLRTIYTHGAHRQNVKILKSPILKNRVLVFFFRDNFSNALLNECWAVCPRNARHSTFV